MKILICGMPRSMTTWAFNVVRALLADEEVKTIWIEPSAKQLEDEFAEAGISVLAKCHHFSEGLAAAAELIIYSYRDIRTAAVSFHRKFASSCTQGQLDGWVESGRAWLPLAQIVLRYESVENFPLQTVARLRSLLIEKFGSKVIRNVSDEDVLRRVEIEFELRQATSEISYDSATMITPAHRTFQPLPRDLLGTDKEMYERVGREFSVWLSDHGYVRSEEHGQELEYRISAELLRSFSAPVVVDVGMARGSFTQLACDAGAAKVIGFEPLPRHLDYLALKYAGLGQVDIHPFAVSFKSGLAKLHIATDFEGNELDFHHTLSDLGDSATVLRSGKELEVKTVSLGDFAANGSFPDGVDFLKVDTDGHDLSVLEGLGELRPHIILAEYWDSLPDTSGHNTYTLNDLAGWARGHGYDRILVVRRHARIELIELDAPLTLAGDWGNVFFFRDDFDVGSVIGIIERFTLLAYHNLCNYVLSLVHDCEAKEAEIRHLASSVAQKTYLNSSAASLQHELEAKEKVIQELKLAYDSTMERLLFLESNGKPPHDSI